MVCPVCNSTDINLYFSLKCKNFDNSYLYDEIKICICQSCSHVFNLINDVEYNNLMLYYEKEYSPINLHSTSTVNDLPGTLNEYSLNRYEKIYNFLSPYLKDKDLIVDMGCASGGFLEFLNKKKKKFDLFGVELSDIYVQKAKEKGLNVIKGSAEKTNLDSNFADVVILDQVLEHIKDLNLVVNEINRILKPKGILYIGIPNASFYNKFSFFNFYWFLLREHLQHFNIYTVNFLFQQTGFSLLNFSNFTFPMVGESFFLPCLSLIFKKAQNKNSFNFLLDKNWLFNYINSQTKELEYLKSLNLKFNADTYIWGIGREFFHLIAQNIINFEPCVLIDSNHYKQRNLKVNGKPIFSPLSINFEDENKKILFTAVAHQKKLKQYCEGQKFKGTYFFI